MNLKNIILSEKSQILKVTLYLLKKFRLGKARDTKIGGFQWIGKGGNESDSLTVSLWRVQNVLGLDGDDDYATF